MALSPCAATQRWLLPGAADARLVASVLLLLLASKRRRQCRRPPG